MRRAQPSETADLKEWIGDHHYLASAPPGFIFLLEFIEGPQRVGGMILGRPAARQYDPNSIMQLHRVFFVDEMPKNTESKALATMRKFVRVWYPTIRLLLSYSDPEQGHAGTIYAADGWCPLGMTDGAWGYGWASRQNRRDQPISKKQRWVRTP
jgi:hypothetical protein